MTILSGPAVAALAVAVASAAWCLYQIVLTVRARRRTQEARQWARRRWGL